MGIEQDQAETKIVRQTALENLLLRAQTSKEKQRRQKELEQQEQSDKEKRVRLVRRITSVYFFIRLELGLGHETITIEEFEATEEKLDELALRNAWRWIVQNPLAALWMVVMRDDAVSAWHFYKNNGYFSRQTKPFVSTTGKLDIHLPRDFEFDHLANGGGGREKEIAMMHPMTVPPNIKKLFEEVWKKRYPLMRI